MKVSWSVISDVSELLSDLGKVSFPDSSILTKIEDGGKAIVSGIMTFDSAEIEQGVSSLESAVSGLESYLGDNLSAFEQVVADVKKVIADVEGKS